MTKHKKPGSEKSPRRLTNLLMLVLGWARAAYNRLTPAERAEGLRRLYGGRLVLGKDNGGMHGIQEGMPGDWSIKSSDDKGDLDDPDDEAS